MKIRKLRTKNVLQNWAQVEVTDNYKHEFLDISLRP